jgi:hypothetical protein
MAWVSAESLDSVDRLLDRPHPVASAQFKLLGRPEARLLLRYQVSEQNRWYIENWEVMQIIIGMLFFFFMLFATRENKFALFLVLLMMAGVVIQRFLLTPNMVSLGRMIDFVPPEAPSGERTQFWVLDSWYWGVELGKLGLGLVLAARLAVRHSPRSADAWQQFDMVDKANHRHVDGL